MNRLITFAGLLLAATLQAWGAASWQNITVSTNPVTYAVITNAWGIFDGSTTKFVAGDGTLRTPAGTGAYAVTNYFITPSTGITVATNVTGTNVTWTLSSTVVSGGNMTNSGASVSGYVPVATDTSGTQWTPTNTFGIPMFSTSPTTNGPSTLELATAGWVRSLLANGSLLYNSTNVAGTAFDASTYKYVGSEPTNGSRSYTPSAGDYIGTVMTTNRYEEVVGPIHITTYFTSSGGAASAQYTLHPEIYYTYDTNSATLLGDYASAPQAITHGAITNQYDFVVSFPPIINTNTPGNGFYIVRRFKIDTKTGTDTLKLSLGTNGVNNTSSHIAFSTPEIAGANWVASGTTNSTLAGDAQPYSVTMGGTNVIGALAGKQAAFTTGAGVTNQANVVSANLAAGSNITLATNANGEISIASTASASTNIDYGSANTYTITNLVVYSGSTNRNTPLVQILQEPPNQQINTNAAALYIKTRFTNNTGVASLDYVNAGAYLDFYDNGLTNTGTYSYPFTVAINNSPALRVSKHANVYFEGNPGNTSAGVFITANTGFLQFTGAGSTKLQPNSDTASGTTYDGGATYYKALEFYETNPGITYPIILSSMDGFGSNGNAQRMVVGSGRPTGSGSPGAFEIRTGTYTNSSATTLRMPTTRAYYAAKPMALTESSATRIVTFSLPTNNFLSGTIEAAVRASDANFDLQSLQSKVTFNAVNKAGTVAATIGQTDSTLAESAGGSTLTAAYTIAQNGNGIDISCNAASSLTQTRLECHWMAISLNGTAYVIVTE